MSKWITDRLPNPDEIKYTCTTVWVTTNEGTVEQTHFTCVCEGQPWMIIDEPDPYVPSRDGIDPGSFSYYANNVSRRCNE